MENVFPEEMIKRIINAGRYGIEGKDNQIDKISELFAKELEYDIDVREYCDFFGKNKNEILLEMDLSYIYSLPVIGDYFYLIEEMEDRGYTDVGEKILKNPSSEILRNFVNDAVPTLDDYLNIQNEDDHKMMIAFERLVRNLHEKFPESYPLHGKREEIVKQLTEKEIEEKQLIKAILEDHEPDAAKTEVKPAEQEQKDVSQNAEKDSVVQDEAKISCEKTEDKIEDKTKDKVEDLRIEKNEEKLQKSVNVLSEYPAYVSFVANRNSGDYTSIQIGENKWLNEIIKTVNDAVYKKEQDYLVDMVRISFDEYNKEYGLKNAQNNRESLYELEREIKNDVEVFKEARRIFIEEGSKDLYEKLRDSDVRIEDQEHTRRY